MMQKPAIPDLDNHGLLSLHSIYSSLLRINHKAKQGKVLDAVKQFTKTFDNNTTRWNEIVAECELELTKRKVIFNQLKLET